MQKYKWNAEDYEAHSRSQQLWGQELISKLHLKNSEHVLDIGCGDGKITAEISRIVTEGNVLGIDNSENMITLAKRRYPKISYPNLKFQIVDAVQLNYQEKFDVVFSNAVLHWIDDHVSLLSRIFKCLKPGGRALLQMGGKGNASEIITVLSSLINNKSWKRYFKDFEFPYHFYGPEEYTKWINQTGFVKSSVELIPKNMEHNGLKEFEAWIRTTWLPYLKTIPNDLRNKFISQISENYFKAYPTNERSILLVKMVRLEVALVKPYNELP